MSDDSKQSETMKGEDQEQEEANLRKAEKEEEAKLKAKYPQVLRPGGSSFLQKRLHKGQKYFDSGDYNMAKAKGQKTRTPLSAMAQQPTGEAIPTPDSLPTRKTSLVQSKLATGLS
ncbi:cAMP-regulated phosphoprotein 19-like isoform X2 [Centruroides sculpturatus]|uniref:cAMP-regulated phosphoprotein 19-like isoform X1 n=1 Tax=Centruroides sculpturatus TaxID=218467 RepID=UPI000C6EEC12|nr:cAMP-regulated phosphoprotein 19-like isoform X1 [Centruroides sculpturatus]XP_023220035.1 cAMP-regulated phosphoprotein 19-like isoform X2 [Centruroides sculpturatus]